ncbi:MAG: LysR family transcriptional regulator [Gammaproteobacteria bacterium]|nr:LysR family transcriptional regulator [Gammaproteobacteria bacterium]
MDKFKCMQVFTRVAKAGSFVAAAKELGMSKAMATKYIAQLEASLDARLLNRTTRKLSLTETGIGYLNRCLEILEDVEEAEATVLHLQREPKGVLHISSPPFFGSYHLIPAIAAFNQLHPDLSFNLTLQGITPDIIEQGLDISILLNSLPNSNLIARRLVSSEIKVCASPEYINQFGQPDTPEDLASHACLTSPTLAPGDRWVFRRDGISTTVKVKGPVHCNMISAIRSAALNSIGIARLPTYIIGSDIRKQRLTHLFEDFESDFLDIHAVYPHRKHLSAKVVMFVDFLCDRLRSESYWDNWSIQNNSDSSPI